MSGYAKLFSTITESTLWEQAKEVRILFVTMLARADAVGFVEASVPGLARIANLSRKETEMALDVLMSPDPDSKDKTNDGRRIRATEGGWMILNYVKYRKKRSEEERREYMREYMRLYRSKPVNDIVNKGKLSKQCKPMLAHADAEADANTEAEKTLSGVGEREHVDVVALGMSFQLFWREYPRKHGKLGAFAVWKEINPDEELVTKIVNAVKAQAQWPEWKRKGGQFIPKPKNWLEEGRWSDESVSTQKDAEKDILRKMALEKGEVFDDNL